MKFHVIFVSLVKNMCKGRSIQVTASLNGYPTLRSLNQLWYEVWNNGISADCLSDQTLGNTQTRG